jgi:hypothetical protein
MKIGQKAILENPQPGDWLDKGTIVQITEIFDDYLKFKILESLDDVSNIGVVLGNSISTSFEGFNSRFKLID